MRYQYGFSATPHEVTDEWLYAWPSGRMQVWFERSRSETSGEPSWKHRWEAHGRSGGSGGGLLVPKPCSCQRPFRSTARSYGPSSTGSASGSMSPVLVDGVPASR